MERIKEFSIFPVNMKTYKYMKIEKLQWQRKKVNEVSSAKKSQKKREKEEKQADVIAKGVFGSGKSTKK